MINQETSMKPRVVYGLSSSLKRFHVSMKSFTLNTFSPIKEACPISICTII